MLGAARRNHSCCFILCCQAEALNRPGVLTGRNLVFCAPTSSGKSIVADVLMLRRLHATRRPALYVLPYVALCSERVAKLKKYMAPLGRYLLCLWQPPPLSPGLEVITFWPAEIAVTASQMF